MLVMYRGYTLVVVRENGKSQVKIFSRVDSLMGTRASTTDETALDEARQAVDTLINVRRAMKLVPPVPPAGAAPVPQAHL
jgi:hypothetical protein